MPLLSNQSVAANQRFGETAVKNYCAGIASSLKPHPIT